MSDVVERLRAVNPVPRDLSTGWSSSAAGTAAQRSIDVTELAAPPRNRRQWFAAALAAAVVLALATSAVLVRGLPGSAAPPPASMVDRLAHGHWKQIDAGPARGLDDATTVWTGRELIVWGQRGTPQTSEGVAFDTATGRWRTLAPSPLGDREGAVVRWLGDEMLVWGGWDRSAFRLVPAVDGARYDPKTDTWRRMAPAPFGPPSAGNGATTAVWTGREMIATNPVAPQAPAAAAYRPATNTWETLPEPPASLAANEGLKAVWTGREVVYLVPSGFVAARAAMIFDPDRRSWRSLPWAFPSSRAATVGLVGDRGSAIAVAWTSETSETAALRWAHLQPATGRWVDGVGKLRHPFLCDPRTTPGPGAAIIACSAGDFVTLDARAGRWTRIPAPPAPVFAPAWWTGRALLGISGRPGHLSSTGNTLLMLTPSRD